MVKLNEIKVSRHISLPNPTNAQLHVFSDASERAYGACVYLRTTNENNEVQVSLVCSKSRVAPVSSTTLPRLELCGAVVMAELTEKVKAALGMPIDKITYWTDSELVLSWINREGSYKTFVANRVAEIKRLTCVENWRHVPTKSNPADLISRGVMPENLVYNDLWWYGPTFLFQDEQEWPQNKPEFKSEPSEEKRVTSVLVAAPEPENFIDSIQHGNSVRTLQHVVAYCQRVVLDKNRKASFTMLNLTPKKLDDAMDKIIKHFQKKEFSHEILRINRGRAFDTKIASLSPFIDDNGILRVGGRLEAASIPYGQKHPALLPRDHIITRLIMERIHRDNKHAEALALLAITRQKYWPRHGKRMAQSIVQNCYASGQNPSYWSK